VHQQIISCYFPDPCFLLWRALPNLCCIFFHSEMHISDNPVRPD
jgi:hypothetical protein